MSIKQFNVQNTTGLQTIMM